MKISIVILYYNRSNEIIRLLSHLNGIMLHQYEILVVDNASDDDLSAKIHKINKNVTYIRLKENIGAVARNKGFDQASGEIVICLDDDVYGITDNNIITLIKLLENEEIAAICFKVIDPNNNEITNWSHQCEPAIYSNTLFETNRITEGAVAYRTNVLQDVGGYFEKYFISHEGPDLACRIMNAGKKIVYCPEIVVEHHHSTIGRTSWRRYYYDTRNVIWLCVRNYPFLYSIKKLFWGIFPMFVYSVRDGYLKYWMKGIYDGIRELPEIIKNRQVLSAEVIKRIKNIEANRPKFLSLAKKRLAQKNVRI